MSAGRAIILLLSLVLLAGCSTTNDVVGRGPLQKRKYRPGWHLDLARASKAPTPDRRTVEGPDHLEARTVIPDRIVEPMNRPPVVLVREATSEPLASIGTTSPPDRDAAPVVALTHPGRSVSGPVGPDPSQGPVQEEGHRYWNRMAIISGVFLLLLIGVVIAMFSTWNGGGIFWYVLLFTFLTGLIGLLLAIKHNERGKGIAILSLAVSLLIIGLFIATR